MPVLTVTLLAVAACGAPTTEDGVPLAPEETPAVIGTPFTRVWDEREGWYDPPPAPIAAPVERWRQQFPPGTLVEADPEGSAVAVAQPAGSQITAARDQRDQRDTGGQGKARGSPAAKVTHSEVLRHPMRCSLARPEASPRIRSGPARCSPRWCRGAP